MPSKVAKSRTLSKSVGGVGTPIIAFGRLGSEERIYPSCSQYGFHDKASLVKVNVVTEASTIQDEAPFRYASIRTPFAPALQ